MILKESIQTHSDSLPIFAPGVDSYLVLPKCHAILSYSLTDILCSNNEQWMMSTCLRGGVQGQASNDGKISWMNSAVLCVSIVRVNQQLHHLQMTLLTRRSQHPVQQILTHTGAYRKRVEHIILFLYIYIYIYIHTIYNWQKTSICCSLE